MKSEYVAGISGVSGAAGVFASRYAEKNIALLRNKWLNAGIGIGAFVLGWLMDYDGVGDAVEAFGAGYALGAIL